MDYQLSSCSPLNTHRLQIVFLFWTINHSTFSLSQNNPVSSISQPEQVTSKGGFNHPEPAIFPSPFKCSDVGCWACKYYTGSFVVIMHFNYTDLWPFKYRQMCHTWNYNLVQIMVVTLHYGTVPNVHRLMPCLLVLHSDSVNTQLRHYESRSQRCSVAEWSFAHCTDLANLVCYEHTVFDHCTIKANYGLDNEWIKGKMIKTEALITAQQ